MFETPVVFFVFNRPETTRQVWARIRDARPRHLFVVADGPRPDRPSDGERCWSVRQLVETVDWPCVVRREYSEVNLGAARRVSSGLDWVFSLVEEAVILEDDCLPDSTFFPFCAELLARYRNEPRVAQIAGCSFQPASLRENTSYFFSRYTHSWGWATWRRAWNHYDHSMQAWLDHRGAGWLEKLVPDPVERRIWQQSFDATLEGKVDAWDYRWTLAAWCQGCVSVLPYRNLISNLGFGADATHTQGASPWNALPLSPMPFPLVHPASLARDEIADERTGRLVFRPPPWPTRLRRRLRKLFNR